MREGFGVFELPYLKAVMGTSVPIIYIVRLDIHNKDTAAVKLGRASNPPTLHPI